MSAPSIINAITRFGSNRITLPALANVSFPSSKCVVDPDDQVNAVWAREQNAVTTCRSAQCSVSISQALAQDIFWFVAGGLIETWL